MTFQDFTAKKVFGIPILYVIGAAVAIFVVVAVKMKPSADKTAEEETPPDAADVNGDVADPYDDFETKGTVVVAPQPSPSLADNANSSITNNDTWKSRGVQFLGQQHSIPGTQANAALNKFLNDEDRSYQENEWVNMVIRELGPPPDQVSGGGAVGAKPATKQFGTPPGTHTVESDKDNTFPAIAALYYGRAGKDELDLLQTANVGIGIIAPYPIGTKVVVPAFAPPKMYKVPAGKGETAAVIASKNGIVGSNAMVILGRMNNSNESSMNPAKLFAPGSVLKVGPTG